MNRGDHAQMQQNIRVLSLSVHALTSPASRTARASSRAPEPAPSGQYSHASRPSPGPPRLPIWDPPTLR